MLAGLTTRVIGLSPLFGEVMAGVASAAPVCDVGHNGRRHHGALALSADQTVPGT